ncbi:hypothetical protein LJR289_001171 [Pseudoduganella sp. LjRoot289]|uniref:DUF6984 family protein n=1 Tax=Pseudoduganella sp. LjRoot289 TaxID=3342314 RepID=UPI003ECECED7
MAGFRAIAGHSRDNVRSTCARESRPQLKAEHNIWAQDLANGYVSDERLLNGRMRSVIAMLPVWTGQSFGRRLLRTLCTASVTWSAGLIVGVFWSANCFWTMRHTNSWMDRSMLDESRLSGRALRPDEQKVLVRLLDMAGCSAQTQLLNRRVVDMNDGGMGSVRFISPSGGAHGFGQCVAEARYADADGVPVFIALNLDDLGDLYELDFWKADFSPLRTYPSPDQLAPVESV